VRNKLEAREARERAATVKTVEELTITTLEGWTLKDIAAYLEAKAKIPAETFLKAQGSYPTTGHPILKNIPKGYDLEGFLFPDTYRILANATSDEIIEKLLENFELKFADASENSRQEKGRFVIPDYEELEISGNKGLSLYEVVIMASIK
jgi:cell division protein YceG involved in septum cleavage